MILVRGKKKRNTDILLDYEALYDFLTLYRQIEAPVPSRSKMKDDVKRNLSVLMRLHETFGWNEIVFGLRAYGVLARDGSTLPVKSLTSTISSLQAEKQGHDQGKGSFDRSGAERQNTADRSQNVVPIERGDDEAALGALGSSISSIEPSSAAEAEPSMEDQIRRDAYESYSKYFDQEP